MSEPTKCETCTKSSLSLLLLRPSVVAHDKRLAPPGSAQVTTDAAAVQGLVPERAPTESRYVVRLLRAGYVYLYIPSPPKGMKAWQIFRVTDQADLVPQGSPWFDQAGASVACTRSEHNALGLKILSIPQAHKITEVWIAYSANLWNDKLLRRNGANPHAMQKLSLGGGSPNTFKPSADALRGKVLECALKELRVNKARDHDFPFFSIDAQVDDLVAQLQRAAAVHPKTAGKELAAVLRDPVGLATELNALRLRRNELASQEIEKPQNVHPLNSSSTLLGLRQSLLDAKLADSFVNVSPLRTRSAYEQSKPSLPAGTEWQALTREERQLLVKEASGTGWFSGALLSPYKKVFSSADLGRIVYPDHNARAHAWAEEQIKKTWGKIADCYDESARSAWVKGFEAKMKAQQYEPLARFEEDWRGAADDAATLAYFKLHFDPQDPNDPREHHSPGRIYAQESQYIHAPAPITTGEVLDKYLVMQDKPIADDAAVVLRALVGNQQSLFQQVQAFVDEAYTELTTAPGQEAGQGEGKRDKAYDLLKGLADKSNVFKKYSWMGDALCAYSTGQLAALSAAALGAAARTQSLAPKLARTLGRLQALWGVQQAVELSLQAALSGQAPKLPVFITMKVSVDEALAALRAHDAPGTRTSKNAVKRMRRGGVVQLSLLTDSETLRAAQGSVDTALKTPGSGTVYAGPAIAGASAAAGSAIGLTEDQFLELYAQQSKFGTYGAKAVRQALSEGTADIRAITLSIDGRLAIGSLIVQGLGLVNGFKQLADARTAKEARDAWYGIYDSAAGAMGGLLEMWAVAVSTRTAAKLGEAAAARSIGLGALRFAGNIAGAAGGVVNAVSAWAKEDEALVAGNRDVAVLYRYSGRAFAASSAVSAVAGIGVAAEVIAAREAGGAALQQAARAIALRAGAEGTATFLGISLSGWGLVLLGAGIAFQVYAVVITPTPLQEWAGRSYFGKGEKKFPKGDWKAEHDALMEAINAGSAPARKGDGKPAAQESPKIGEIYGP